MCQYPPPPPPPVHRPTAAKQRQRWLRTVQIVMDCWPNCWECPPPPPPQPVCPTRVQNGSSSPSSPPFWPIHYAGRGLINTLCKKKAQTLVNLWELISFPGGWNKIVVMGKLQTASSWVSFDAFLKEPFNIQFRVWTDRGHSLSRQRRKGEPRRV